MRCQHTLRELGATDEKARAAAAVHNERACIAASPAAKAGAQGKSALASSLAPPKLTMRTLATWLMRARPLVAVARLLLLETQVDAAERPRHGNQGGRGMAGFFFGRNGSRAA
jgi:hypothetical protein